VHGQGRPLFDLIADLEASFRQWLRFYSNDWEELWEDTLQAMVYISRNTADSIDRMMGWPQWMVIQVHDAVSSLIERENEANRSSSSE
jgi:hypothetical protein